MKHNGVVMAAASVAFLLQGCAGLEPKGSSETIEFHSRNTNENQIVDQKIPSSSSPKADPKAVASADYHFSMAQAYAAEGQTDRAIQEFKLAVTYDPNSALLRARLAAEYLKKGLFSSAMEETEIALKLDPSFIDARLMFAGILANNRQYAESVMEYGKVLSQDPENEEAAVFRAQTQMEDGKLSDAKSGLEKFLTLKPQAPMAWYYLARVEQAQDHFESAVAAFKKALDIHPGFAQAGMGLGYLYESRELNDLALNSYLDLYRETQDLSAANRIATIYLKQEKYAEAMSYLEAVKNADPDDLNAQVKLGLVLMELKEYSKAITVFEKILTKTPDSDRVNYYLGSLYEEINSKGKAISHLKKIQRDSPLYEDAALHVAYLLKQQNFRLEAKNYLKTAMKSVLPSPPSFYIFIASLDEDEKNIKSSISTLEQGVKKYPENEKLRYYLGSLYDRAGQVDQGITQMEEILALNADNADALNYLGYTFTNQGIRLDEAEKLLLRALNLKKDNGYILDSWAWLQYKKGNIDEALTSLEKAVALVPDESTILDHLGDVYLKANLWEKALVTYTKASEFAKLPELQSSLRNKIQSLRTELVRNGKIIQEGRAPAGKN